MFKKTARPFVLLALLAPALFADTVTLKSGEKVEGKIISNTDAGVTVQVRLPGGITDERVIKKAEIGEIKEVTPDAEAWPALKAISLGEDSYEPEEYDRWTKALKDFATQFPQSPNTAEAQKKISTLEEEKKRVDAGELKVAGKWLTKAQVEEDRVQIKGRQLLSLMKKQAAAAQYVAAMNTYSTLEKAAPGMPSFPDAVVIAQKVLPPLRTAAEARRTQIKAQVEENKRRLSNVQGAEKLQLEALQKQQAAQVDALVRAEEAKGLRWMPINPSNDKSISALISRATSELSSVNRIDLDKIRVSISAGEKSSAALAAKDIPAAERALTEASSSWPMNEMIKRLQPKIAVARVKAAEEAVKAAAAAASLPPQPPPLAKATPTPAPVAAEPVAEEPPKEDDGSIFSKPAFWVIIFVVLGIAALVMKFLRKFKDPTKNILDQ